MFHLGLRGFKAREDRTLYNKKLEVNSGKKRINRANDGKTRKRREYRKRGQY